MITSNALQNAALARLKAQRDVHYYEPWKPGKQISDEELIWAYIIKLRNELSLARDDLFLRGEMRQ